MRKTLTIFFTTAILCAICANAQKINHAQKLAFAESIIERYYVDKVKPDTIVDEAIRAMLKTLDPHSAYSTPDETKDLTEPLDGNFSGIGISFNMLQDSIYVIELISGGPAEKVGMRPGDRIISADGVKLSGVKMKNTNVRKYLRGERGTKVSVEVVRHGEPAPLTFRITRDNIPMYSVDASYMISPTIGYIRISRFASDTGKEVKEAMSKLGKQGMKDLIIDLESNGGGYLNSAVDISEIFVPWNGVIVSTNGPHVEPMVYKSSVLNNFNGKVVVMVDQYSASASEILAGAIQDNDRGIIVGRRTFGKGLVQRPFPFPDGSMIRLTIARYYTPSGRCIQKPYKEGEGDKYREDLINRYKAGEYSSFDSIHIPDSLVFYTKNNHREVYGGGGIMPDRFVPIDTTEYSPYATKLIAKGVINFYAIDYVDKNRDKIKKTYPTVENFIDRYNIDEDMLNEVIQRASSDKIDFNEDEYSRSKQYIQTLLKAYIARDVYNTAAYYRIMNTRNPVYREAIKVISNQAEYNSLLSPDSNKKK